MAGSGKVDQTFTQGEQSEKVSILEQKIEAEAEVEDKKPDLLETPQEEPIQ